MVHGRLIVGGTGIRIRHGVFHIQDLLRHRRVTAFKFHKGPLPFGIIPISIFQKLNGKAYLPDQGVTPGRIHGRYFRRLLLIFGKTRVHKTGNYLFQINDAFIDALSGIV
jgi:hypothetical protein